MGWVVQLVGEDIDLGHLSREFSSKECTVTKEGSEYHLRSALFDSLTDPQDVHDSAKKLVENMNGLAATLWSGFHAVTVKRVIGIAENGERRPSAFYEGSVTVRFGVSSQVALSRADGTFDSSQQPGKVETWLRVALEDPGIVGQALKIFGSPGTSPAEVWRNLYRVYDIIGDDIRGEKRIIENRWATERELDLFRRTAQPERHYQGKFQPPENPMLLEAAKSLIAGILQKWLQSRSQ